MEAKVKIAKSFDEGKQFTKEWTSGDFEQFFMEEGQYLDKLAKILAEHGKKGESFEVTYTATVTL